MKRQQKELPLGNLTEENIEKFKNHSNTESNDKQKHIDKVIDLNVSHKNYLEDIGSDVSLLESLGDCNIDDIALNTVNAKKDSNEQDNLSNLNSDVSIISTLGDIDLDIKSNKDREKDKSVKLTRKENSKKIKNTAENNISNSSSNPKQKESYDLKDKKEFDRDMMEELNELGYKKVSKETNYLDNTSSAEINQKDLLRDVDEAELFNVEKLVEGARSNKENDEI
jgi:hypothetical protein